EGGLEELDEEIAWEGKPGEARRGSSLGNRDGFLRAGAEANLDGLWLAANNRWDTGELSLRVISPQGVLRRGRYVPAYHSAIYSGKQEMAWNKTLFLAEVGAEVYFWISGNGFETNHPVEIVCDWRVGAARSEVHRAQPWQDCERQWELTSENSL